MFLMLTEFLLFYETFMIISTLSMHLSVSSVFKTFWHKGVPNAVFIFLKNSTVGTSLVVQWLRIQPANAGDTGLIPGQGTKIPHAHVPHYWAQVPCSPYAAAKISCATTETWCRQQINKYHFKKEAKEESTINIHWKDWWLKLKLQYFGHLM